jgi:hypothetical protein
MGAARHGDALDVGGSRGSEGSLVLHRRGRGGRSGPNGVGAVSGAGDAMRPLAGWRSALIQINAEFSPSAPRGRPHPSIG